MLRLRFYPFILLTTALACSLLADIDKRKLRQDDLPCGWSIQKEIALPPDKLPDLADHLGGHVIALANQFIDACGLALQINYVECATVEDAINVHKKISQMKGSSEFCLRKERTVVELVTQNNTLAFYAKHLLGMEHDEWTTYDVTFRIATVEEGDDSLANEFFNFLLKYAQDPTDDLQAKISRLREKFTFGNRIRLRTENKAYFKATYQITPQPIAAEEQNGITTYYFENLPKFLGIPFVEVKATIAVRDCFEPVPAEQEPDYAALCADTKQWPVDSKALWKLTGEIVKDVEGPRARAAQLVKWVYKEIAYRGPMGTRYGVEKALGQRYGRCWDKSDIFVTLARVAGIPARQVAGWLYGSCGHVWAEIYIEKEGWIPVDPTTPWLGTSREYLPFFSTDTGDMHILYLSMPEIVKRDEMAN